MTLSFLDDEPIRRTAVDTRIDPFIGFRYAEDFSRRWAVGLRGDIGADLAQHGLLFGAAFHL